MSSRTASTSTTPTGTAATITTATAAGTTTTAAATGLALAGAVGYAVYGPWTHPGSAGVYVVYGVAWALFVLGAFLVRRLPVRRAVLLILVGAVVLPVLAAGAPPRTSDDAYRYAFDGRVQAAGRSPYAHAPTDPEVARFRDDWLFPRGECAGWFKHPLPDGSCTRINRPDVHTIYPPVAESYYWLVHVVTPSGRREPVQAAAALLAILVTLALLAVLRGFGRDPRHAVWWAWCPMVALEAGNNAHVDVLGVLLMVLGLAAIGGRRPILGGVLLGGAVATKMFPAAALAGGLRRAPVRLLGSAALTVLLVYLPHVLAVGPAVLGYLPGYLREERYDDGARFGLLGLVLPTGSAPYAAVVVLIGLAVVVAARADPDRPWQGALTLTGGMLFVLTPAYPWYALLVVALVALDGRRPEWLALGPAGYVLYLTWGLELSPGQIRAIHQLGYGVALLCVLGAGLGRRLRPADGTTGRPAAFHAWKPPIRSVASDSPKSTSDAAARLDA
ncbi:DUF2029 domain-containing protein [Streptomyces sp. SID5474]|nr:DUF2029 domain-containing protein [Streptomyces sp. SID5474]